MPSDLTQIKYEDMAKVGVTFEDYGEFIKRMLSRLYQKVHTLESGAWEGENADKFYRAMNDEVFPALSRLATVMNTSADVVAQIIHTFQEAEEEAGNAFPADGGGDAAGRSGGSGGIGGFAGGGGGGGAAGGFGGSGASGGSVMGDGSVKPGGDVMGDGSVKPGGDVGKVDTNVGFSGGGKTQFGSDSQTWGEGGNFAPGAEDSGFKPNASVGAGASVSTGGAAASGGFSAGGVNFAGEAGSWQAGAGVSGGLNLGQGTLFGKAEASAGVNLVHGSASAQVAGVDLAAEGGIVAKVEAEGKIEFDPKNGTAQAQGSVGGFAGAEASAKVGYEGQYGGVGVGVTGRAGIGAEASGEIGFENGTFSAKGQVGAALGLGGSVNVDVSVNVLEAASAIVDWGGEAADLIQDVGSSIAGSLGF